MELESVASSRSFAHGQISSGLHATHVHIRPSRNRFPGYRGRIQTCNLRATTVALPKGANAIPSKILDADTLLTKTIEISVHNIVTGTKHFRLNITLIH